ncbi:MAG: cysteine rich repeat-containing protein [Pseudomonadales bacterium]|nr:cysteine rich repeat-containing protein [Pseudomonadales bacterium]
MRKLVFPVLLIALGFAGSAFAQETLVDMIKTGCETEIKTYCSQVTPGEKRMLACFYAHEDKLSVQCAHTLYQASETLKAAVLALNYVAAECQNDVITHCADITMGEGRIVECLQAKAEKVSPECKGAMTDDFK